MSFLRKISSSIQKRYFYYFRNGYSVEKKYNCKWLIDWSNNIDKKLTANLFEDKEINFLLKILKFRKTHTFIDIGAHAGLYSIIIKTWFPSIKIISFEPDKQNRFQFFGNIFLNNLHNKIQVYDIGLSNKKGLVPFGIRTEAFGKRGGKAINNNSTDKVQIDKLDNLLNYKKTDCLIKIDVEGHECEVIEGAKLFLKNNFCLIQVELWNEKSFNNFNNIIKNFGYQSFQKIKGTENYYFKNFD